jgi:hypothetical protein
MSITKLCILQSLKLGTPYEVLFLVLFAPKSHLTSHTHLFHHDALIV